MNDIIYKPLNNLDIAMLNLITNTIRGHGVFSVIASVHNNIAIFTLRPTTPESEVCVSTIETDIQLCLGDSVLLNEYRELELSFTGYAVYFDDRRIA